MWQYVCVCVCWCVSVCVCHVCMHACMYVCVWMCVFVCAHTYHCLHVPAYSLGVCVSGSKSLFFGVIYVDFFLLFWNIKQLTCDAQSPQFHSLNFLQGLWLPLPGSYTLCQILHRQNNICEKLKLSNLVKKKLHFLPRFEASSDGWQSFITQPGWLRHKIEVMCANSPLQNNVQFSCTRNKVLFSCSVCYHQSPVRYFVCLSANFHFSEFSHFFKTHCHSEVKTGSASQCQTSEGSERCLRLRTDCIQIGNTCLVSVYNELRLTQVSSKQLTMLAPSTVTKECAAKWYKWYTA